jgi:hypothetical protein
MITITREYENFGATTNNPNDLWNAYCNIRGCAHRILNCADVKLYKFLTPVIEPYTLSKNIIHSVMENRFTHPFYYYVHRYNLFCKYDSQRPYWQFTLECMLMEKDEYISVCKKYKERPIYQKYMILMKSSSRYTSYDLLNILVKNPKFDIQRAWYIYECKDKRFPNGFMEKICKIVEEKGTPETLKWLTDTFPA